VPHTQTHTHKGDKMSEQQNKSGYQLRTDLLGMAMGIVSEKVSRLESNEHFMAENDRKYQKQPVAPFTAEEIIIEAEKLYAFVQKK